MPMREDLPSLYADYFKANPDYTSFAEQAARTVEVPNVPNSVEIWQTFRDAYTEAVIFGRGDVRGAFDQAAEKVRTWPRGAERVAASAATASRPPLTRRLLGRHPVGYLFVAPYVLFLFAIFAYPLGFAVYMSFHDYFFAAPGAIVERPFVGLDNFTTALADPAFRRAMLNVVIFIAINVPLTVFVGLILATALNAAIPFRTFFRASYFVPYVTASVAVIGVWQWLFNSNGLVNSILGPLAPDPSWLVNSFWAMPIIALFATWKQLGFYVLLYLAALQNIPEELYERPRSTGPARCAASSRSPCPGCGRPPPWWSSRLPSPGPTSSPSRTCSPAAAAPPGRRCRRCCSCTPTASSRERLATRPPSGCCWPSA
jgi:multiple sugar transport system permease protein